jgi:hypothetical protein
MNQVQSLLEVSPGNRGGGEMDDYVEEWGRDIGHDIRGFFHKNLHKKYPEISERLMEVGASDLGDTWDARRIQESLKEFVSKRRLYRKGGVYQRVFDKVLEEIELNPALFFSNRLHNSKEYRHLTDSIAEKGYKLFNDYGYEGFDIGIILGKKEVSPDIRLRAATDIANFYPEKYFKSKTLMEDPLYDNLSYEAFFKSISSQIAKMESGRERDYKSWGPWTLRRNLPKSKMDDPRFRELVDKFMIAYTKSANSMTVVGMIKNRDYISTPAISDLLIKRFGEIVLDGRNWKGGWGGRDGTGLRDVGIFFNRQFHKYNPEMEAVGRQIAEEMISTALGYINKDLSQRYYDYEGEEDPNIKIPRNILFRFLRIGLHKIYPDLGKIAAKTIQKNFPEDLEGSGMLHWTKDAEFIDDLKEYLESSKSNQELFGGQFKEAILEEFMRGFMLWSVTNLTKKPEENIERVFEFIPNAEGDSVLDNGYNFRQRLESGTYGPVGKRVPLEEAGEEAIQDMGQELYEEEYYNPMAQEFDMEPYEDDYDEYEEEPEYNYKEEDVENEVEDAAVPSPLRRNIDYGARRASREAGRLLRKSKAVPDHIKTRTSARRDRKQILAIINYLVSE